MKTYISLFSSAGVGCYGFQLEHFHCIATVELLEKRLNIQRYNHKCDYDSGYICGDMTLETTKEQIQTQIQLYRERHHITDVDVLIATPPCQGMSVANLKKGDELKRNSLVVESLVMVQRIRPKFFVFENVRAFLTSACTDVDGKNKAIREAIERNLAGSYNILYKIVNFKDYGTPSSRTRTLVIGVRKDVVEVTPFDIFPDKTKTITLRESIGHLPSLTVMGESSPEDIYHNFRSYDERMIPWIENLKEGQSAFDNPEPERRPHTVVDGIIIPNAQKNGDKYTRQYWDRVGPCIHTRNDILASQNTVHPHDNRVFSIREVMTLMSVPASFEWSAIPYSVLNAYTPEERRKFLKKEEMNIRQTLGEAVPTIIFQKIAHKITRVLDKPFLTDVAIRKYIDDNELTIHQNLLDFIKDNHRMGFAALSKIAELANAVRDDNAAFYTRQDICYAIVSRLPDFSGKDDISILEPSIGVGNFLPCLIQKYSEHQSVNIDVVDIDENSLEVLEALLATLKLPKNVHINLIHADTLLHQFEKIYDIVVGNPPYKKLTKNKKLLAEYKKGLHNQVTNNLFAFFIEKSLHVGRNVALIVPKSLINAPEFNQTRDILNHTRISHLFDFGEKGFKGVKIETICFVIENGVLPSETTIESYITETNTVLEQAYYTDSRFPYWLIYRNGAFDRVANNMEFGIFTAFRDRYLTKSNTSSKGRYRVLKSRNIGNNHILDIPGYDCFVDSINDLAVGQFLNDESAILVPNLTYNPRACRMPKNCIADGSVAILKLKNNHQVLTDGDIEYFASDEYRNFYSIARNRASRSMNIDNNSVFFFGIKR